MERWTKPIALITTVQPYLLVWVLGITFFVTLTMVAIISRGRSWRQLITIFCVSFILLSLASIISTRFTADVQVIDVEIIVAGD